MTRAKAVVPGTRTWRTRAGTGVRADLRGPYDLAVRVHALVRPDREHGVARFDVAKRQLRSVSLQSARRIDWIVRPERYPKPAIVRGAQRFEHLVHARHISMRRADSGANEHLEQGKLVNVALAAPALDGLLLEPGRTFSFWRAVGRPTAALGYRHGMEIRGGCVVPSIGGGLCLLTNALFRAAAVLDWRIIERHGHTLEAVPSTDEPWGLDATAAWPYIDLRFVIPVDRSPAQLGVRIEDDVLVLEVWSASAASARVDLVGIDDRISIVDGARLRSNRVLRRTVDVAGAARFETIAVNTKRLVAAQDLGRCCLTCDVTGCAGRVTVR